MNIPGYAPYSFLNKDKNMEKYTIKTHYNKFNKVHTVRAFFDNGKQITLDTGNTKDEAMKRLQDRLNEKNGFILQA
jgi:hypothetical protein